MIRDKDKVLLKRYRYLIAAPRAVLQILFE